jgi:hypothetical protein
MKHQPGSWQIGFGKKLKAMSNIYKEMIQKCLCGFKSCSETLRGPH